MTAVALDPRMSEAEWLNLACRSDLATWTKRKRGYHMSPHHVEWCDLRMTARRICIVAPRESSKSETITVNGTAWESIYTPGLDTFIFCASGGLAKEMLKRVRTAISFTDPELVDRAWEDNETDLVLSNFSRIRVAGAETAVRGAHPDRIIGDDVLEEKNCLTAYQRKKLTRWWLGTVSGMAHPGTMRTFGKGRNTLRRYFEPSRVFLVGTPFHQSDLLMSMRSNPLYEFRRYAAEFLPGDLVPGTMAVEIG